MSAATVIPVALAGRGYQVQCGRGLLAQAGALCAPFAKTRRVFVVTDDTVGPLYGPQLLAALEAAGLTGVALQVAAGEASKSWEGLAGLCEGLAAERAERGDLIAALGGGVIGDLTGFAAGVFKRGMDFVQIPTTLLAQVDSSVGGKTAIDIPAGKNLVGLFHQPRAVIVDYAMLDTLSEREMRAGFAEVVKYGLLGDRPFFTWLQNAAADVLARHPEALAHAVETSIRAKAAIVAADERETADLRALLNLGHTFGHGFEAIAGFDGRLLHGEAVACGMALAFHYSAHQGLCPPAQAQEAIEALNSFGFETDPRRLPGGPFDPQAMIAAMAQDKKASGGKLTLILAEGIGRAKSVSGLDLNPVQAYLSAVLGEGLN
jgi:3-dehydroquinate synthase